MKIKNFILDLFFPKFCLFCQREGDFLCQDCQTLLEISNSHQKYKTKYLSDLYYPCSYQNPFVKKLIQGFKYQPFLKELSKPISLLMRDHFQLIEIKNFNDFVLIPIPLEKRKIRWRGFNQAEEIAKNLANFFNLEIFDDVLIKIKETPSQVDLSEEERKENVKGAFFVKNREKIRGKKILLVDDVYTTGSTMEEAAKTLKEAGAKEIIGLVIARANPGQDKISPI